MVFISQEPERFRITISDKDKKSEAEVTREGIYLSVGADKVPSPLGREKK